MSEKTPEQKFKEQAKVRTANVMTSIRRLGKMAGSKTYEYTPDQVAQIMAAVDEELDKVKAAFAGKRSASDVFDFDDEEAEAEPEVPTPVSERGRRPPNRPDPGGGRPVA